PSSRVMSHLNYFPQDYRAGRTAFLAAAEKAGARIATYDAGSTGPDGEPVYTDVALLGREDAPNVFLCNTATHGVEGFCGSGIITGFLDSGETNALPDNVRLVFIHALNCHGFAWVRRVTEENVDLNRNFVDHDQAHPKNAEYTKLHPVILPGDWEDKTVAAAKEKLERYATKHSLYKLQSVLTGGQYDHPDGIFFGGTEPTVAQLRFRQIVEEHVVGAGHVLFLDWHTGLGPYGAGELLGITRPGSPHGDRVSKWFINGLATPAEGQSLSAPLSGTIGSGLRRRLADTDTGVTSLTVEFGTYSVREVLLALIADNWLHAMGDVDSDIGRAIKAQVRKALYPDEDDWKELVWVRGRQILRRGMNGIAEI
ncbi:MAG: M14 family metallopeptidase, partial [Alphaproteobacteria bacterium]